MLSHAEMARAQAARNSGEALTWVENAEKVKTGVDNVLAKDLQDYRSAWNKIVAWCTAEPPRVEGPR